MKENKKLKPGDILHGYIIKRIAFLDKTATTFYELEHSKSGARHIHLENSSLDNCFCVAFKTTPYNDTGVAHILEHIALCGSKKYPVRDPFFNMIKRSVNSFMNAMTSSDWTAYPFSSQNKKDFYNLMDVYLDAAFNPILSEYDFMQEGHRLVFEEPGNIHSDLKIAGVVYNEMKGVFSNPGSIMYRRTMHSIFPDTTYHYESGGDPKAIINLTYEELKAFHKRYYHPSNSYFYTFGNIPLSEHLEFIDEKILSGYDRINPETDVNKASRFSEPKTFKYNYSLKKEDDDGSKNHFAVSWLTFDINDIEELYSFHIINHILLGHSGAVLNKALMESGLGRNLVYGSGLSDQSKEAFFTAGLEDVKEEDSDKIKSLIFDTLNKLVTEGIKDKDIEAALHQLEFSMREISSGHYIFTLNLFFACVEQYIHSGDVLEVLDFDRVIESLKEKLKNPDYLTGLIKKHLIDNKHRIEITLSPDHNKEENDRKALEKYLADIKKSLTDEEKETIVRKNEELKEEQEKENDTSLLPTLKLEDMERKVITLEPRPIKKEISSVPFSFYEQATNGVFYTNILFDTNGLDIEELKLLPLFSTLLTQLGTTGKPYNETAEDVNLYTGGISSSVRIVEKVDSKTVANYLKIKGKALNHNIEKLFELISNFITDYDFNDFKRVKTVINKKCSSLENELISSGHVYARRRAEMNLSESGYLKELFFGVTQIDIMKEIPVLNENDFSDLMEKLIKLGKKIFTSNRMRVFAVGQADINKIESLILKLKSQLPLTDLPEKTEINFDSPVKNEIWTINTGVSYTAKVFKSVNILNPDKAAALKIAANIIGLNYLHPEIREKGGAYGGGASYSTLTGILGFSSYRDPHFLRTVNIFDNVCEYLKSENINSRTVDEFKIKILGEIDNQGTSVDNAVNDYFMELSCLTPQMNQAYKNSIFTATPEDVIEAAR
jgi:presequence protease